MSGAASCPLCGEVLEAASAEWHFRRELRLPALRCFLCPALFFSTAEADQHLHNGAPAEVVELEAGAEDETRLAELMRLSEGGLPAQLSRLCSCGRCRLRCQRALDERDFGNESHRYSQPSHDKTEPPAERRREMSLKLESREPGAVKGYVGDEPSHKVTKINENTAHPRSSPLSLRSNLAKPTAKLTSEDTVFAAYDTQNLVVDYPPPQEIEISRENSSEDSTNLKTLLSFRASLGSSVASHVTRGLAAENKLVRNSQTSSNNFTMLLEPNSVTRNHFYSKEPAKEYSHEKRSHAATDDPDTVLCQPPNLSPAKDTRASIADEEAAFDAMMSGSSEMDSNRTRVEAEPDSIADRSIDSNPDSASVGQASEEPPSHYAACQLCGLAVKRLEFRRHVLGRHYSEAVFRCLLCAYAAKRQGDLASHQKRTHFIKSDTSTFLFTGTEARVAEILRDCFGDRRAYALVERTQCRECGRAVSKYYRRPHVASKHHDGVLHRCRLCPYKSRSYQKTPVEKHLRLEHGKKAGLAHIDSSGLERAEHAIGLLVKKCFEN